MRLTLCIPWPAFGSLPSSFESICLMSEGSDLPNEGFSACDMVLMVRSHDRRVGKDRSDMGGHPYDRRGLYTSTLKGSVLGIVGYDRLVHKVVRSSIRDPVSVAKRGWLWGKRARSKVAPLGSLVPADPVRQHQPTRTTVSSCRVIETACIRHINRAGKACFQLTGPQPRSSVKGPVQVTIRPLQAA